MPDPQMPNSQMLPALSTKTLELPSGLSCQVVCGGPSAASPVVSPPVMFFHPASGASPTDPFLLALAEHFRVYAPVAPGFDDLDDLRKMRTVHDVSLHYDDIVQALGLEQFGLVGHSFGGMFAAEYAAHYPSKVSSLVLIAAVGLWDDGFPVVDMFSTPALELAGLLWADPESPEAKAGQESLMQISEDDTVESIIRIVRGLVTAGKFMMPIPDKGLNRRLYRISAPTLVLWGEDDKLVPPQYAPRFVEAIAVAEAKIFPRAGHMLTLEHTAEITNEVATHIQTTHV